MTNKLELTYSNLKFFCGLYGFLITFKRHGDCVELVLKDPNAIPGCKLTFDKTEADL